MFHLGKALKKWNKARLLKGNEEKVEKGFLEQMQMKKIK